MMNCLKNVLFESKKLIYNFEIKCEDAKDDKFRQFREDNNLAPDTRIFIAGGINSKPGSGTCHKSNLKTKFEKHFRNLNFAFQI